MLISSCFQFDSPTSRKNRQAIEDRVLRWPVAVASFAGMTPNVSNIRSFASKCNRRWRNASSLESISRSR